MRSPSSRDAVSITTGIVVPEQYLAIEVLADDGIFRGGFEDVGHEVHGLLSLTNNRAIKQFRCHQGLQFRNAPAQIKKARLR